ncbi:hypothetical protein [Crateriforma conspicua]|uniref:Uncharacterized protein n=1 Tax=Crateriforma conspicua TaxID=2527996 RepID=A0A5C6FT55_9PLAN|nr:hypothetical protein [Crateriforma conspicua]TWU66069.1 hypothetical protein V7x_16260 [Crateriforma conspicua]
MPITRRQFCRAATAASFCTWTLSDARADSDANSSGIGKLETMVPYRQITKPPGHHWFGYYDKREFDPTGTKVLSNRVNFEGRSPTGNDSIDVGYVDTADGDHWVPLGVSNAWGWQQGCMLQWIGRDGRRVLWNDRQGDQFVCRIHDLKSGRTRTIDRPIYTISDDGRFGLSADFRRIDNLRPGYGYDGLADPFVDQRSPKESGVWKVDLETGDSRLILSLDRVAAMPWHDGQTHDEAWHYFNHLLINPSGTRFIVLHRFRPEFDPQTLQYKGGFVTRMLTADLDGNDLYELDPSGKTSHFIWKDDEVVTMWTRPIGMPAGFYDFVDHTDKVTPVGAGVMKSNGHNTYLRGDHGDWILNDTYPSKHDRRQTVYLYHVPSGRRFDLGHFPSPHAYTGEWRCDTHPRCSEDGTQVAIDSPHQDGRQVHLLDISELLARNS